MENKKKNIDLELLKARIDLEKLRMEHEWKMQELGVQPDLTFITEIQKGGRVAVPKPFRKYHNLNNGDIVTVTVKKKQANTQPSLTSNPNDKNPFYKKQQKAVGSSGK